MADQIQGLPPGAVVKPISQQPEIEGLPAGAVVKPIQQAQNQDQPAPGTDNVQKPEQPGFFDRLYQTSGIKGLVDEAKQAHAEGSETREKIAQAYKSGDYGTMAEEALKHIAHQAGYSSDKSTGQNVLDVGSKILGPGAEVIKNAAQSSIQHGGAAINAAKTGDTGKAVEEAATAVPVVGPVAAQVAKPLGEDIGSGNTAGAAGDVVSGLGQAALAMVGGGAGEAGEGAEAGTAAKVAKSAEEIAPAGKALKEAGETVQTETKATRDTKGKAVGAAKEAVHESLPRTDIPTVYEQEYSGPPLDIKDIEKIKDNSKYPENVRKDAQYIHEAVVDSGTKIDDAMRLFGSDDLARALGGKLNKTLNANAARDLNLASDGSLSKVAKKVLDDTADTEQLAGAKDPDISDIRSMADHLSKGENAKGEPLSADPAQADSLKRAFNSKIQTLEAKAKQGGNATALKHVQDLKQAYNDDLYDAYEKYGDPEAAKTLRASSKDYAQTVADQTKGPAKGLLRNQSPEKIVSSIVSGGAKSQSAVESLLKNISTKEGKAVLRDSVDREIWRTSPSEDGNIDMVAARQKFYKLGDTAKALYGDDLKARSEFYDAAAKEQTARQALAEKKSVKSQIGTKLTKATATGVGAAIGSVGGPVGEVSGAIAGHVVGGELADAVFNQGKSGAVKIGISPTEQIVLSPAEAVAKRSGITKFLKAKATKNAPAMTAAYSALKGETPSSGKTEDRGSL